MYLEWFSDYGVQRHYYVFLYGHLYEVFMFNPKVKLRPATPET